MSWEGIVDAVFSVQQMMEKYEVAGRKLNMAFVNLEKAFDRAPKRVISISKKKRHCGKGDKSDYENVRWSQNSNEIGG